MDSELKPNAQYWVDTLQLQPHPEGGWYREMFRDFRQVAAINPSGNSQEYAASTAIYFLLDHTQFSAFHKIGASEVWHFYAGQGITIYILHNDGRLETIELGQHPEQGQQFQTIVPPNTWFAARVNHRGGYALCGCTVAPGFEFTEFELASKNTLLKQYPIHENVIVGLTL